MPCEKFKPALIEAALTGADLPPAVHVHVNACAACDAEFARQHSLADAIDTNLHCQMNAPVPTAMLHRLGAHLAEQPQPKRAPRFYQIFATTLATIAVAATIALLLPHKPSKTIEVRRATPPITNFVADHSQADSVRSPETARIAPVHTVHLRTVAQSTEPEVLVPPDERIALDHFMAGFGERNGIALAQAIRSPQREVTVAPLGMPDIQTASLAVTPIQDSDAISRK